MKLFGLLVFVLTACSTSTGEQAAQTQSTEQIVWHWEDEFSEREKEKLVLYLTEVTDATIKILGDYPFKVHYFLHRSESDREPIPWAHTERSEIEGVHFHVNPSFDLSTFRADWTAPHEISHLSIPFLGKSNAWFSEGYASYMQLQVMKEMGIYTAKEMDERYAMKDNLVKGDFSGGVNFVDDVKDLRAAYNFPAMYWGSVRYFRKVDAQLQNQEQHSLVEHIKAYQKENRIKDQNMDDLLQSLDTDLKVPIFKNLYKKCCKNSFGEAFQ